MKLCSLIGLLLGVALAAIWAGCGEVAVEPDNPGRISMTSKYSPRLTPVKSIGTVARISGMAAVDSIRISRARFVLRRINFKTEADSSNFRTAPFVLELNLSGAIQEIGVAAVPFGTYRRIEFNVHRVDSSDLRGLLAAEQAQFQDFLAGARYSIIVEGILFKTGQAPQSFVFRSRIDADQKIDLSPELVVS